MVLDPYPVIPWFFFLISLVLPTNLQEKNPRTKQNKLALSQIRDWLRRGAAYAETKERVLALCFWYTCDSVLKSSFLLPSVGSRWVADTYSEKKNGFLVFQLTLLCRTAKRMVDSVTEVFWLAKKSTKLDDCGFTYHKSSE